MYRSFPISILQGALAGLAARFPSKYMSSLGQGQVIAGIITAVFNIISIATFDGEGKESPSKTAFYCFLVGAIFIVVDLIALIVMTNTILIKSFKSRSRYQK